MIPDAPDLVTVGPVRVLYTTRLSIGVARPADAKREDPAPAWLYRAQVGIIDAPYARRGDMVTLRVPLAVAMREGLIRKN